MHLVEIFNAYGLLDEAEALLVPMIASPDPAVRWRLADVLLGQGKVAEAELHLQAARFRFEDLLGRHVLAFADHGAQFFAGSGNDPCRALGLAQVNVTNRPALRALELAHEVAMSVGDTVAASEFLAAALKRWSETPASRISTLARGLGGMDTR